jgi:hypothetical protein
MGLVSVPVVEEGTMAMKKTAIMLAVFLSGVAGWAAETAKPATFSLGPQGEIQTWLVLGYIPLPVPAKLPAAQAVGKAFGQDLLAPVGGEANLTATGGVQVGLSGTTFVWRAVTAPKTVIPLFQEDDGRYSEKSAAYLYAEIVSPKDEPATLRLGTDDAAKVFLNGRQLFQWDGVRSATPDGDTIVLPLIKGANRLVVRIDNYVGNGGVCARLTRPDGLPALQLGIQLAGFASARQLPVGKEQPWSQVIEAIPPVPPATNECLFGARMTRTMTLLATSHLSGRPVRIMFYGQSIVAQHWTEFVVNRLRERFPRADIIYKKPAIGGYGVPALERTIKHDIWRERPDLVVFHAYSGNDGPRERLIYGLRKETTADILLFTHHMDERALSGWSEEHEASSAHIRRLAQTYDCELADVREEWKDYLRTYPQFAITNFLVDVVHLNTRGCALMAQLVERHFRANTLFPSWTAGRVRWYDPLRSFEARTADEITFTGGGWQPHIGMASGSTNDALKLTFVGNRVDLVLPPSRGSARILIDGQPPSAHNLYHATRPRPIMTVPGRWQSCTLRRLMEGPNMVPETWTLTLHELEVNAETNRISRYRYEVVGSVTGPDGGATNGVAFVSNSGRIRIDPKDFDLSPHYALPNLKPGLQITWDVVPDSRDVVQRSVTTNMLETITIADGLPCREHELTIIPVGDGVFHVAAIEVHRPPLGTGR